MLDFLGVDEDFAIDGLDLVGAWSEHLLDDVWSLPWLRELMAVLVALDEAEHQVLDVKHPTPHSTLPLPAEAQVEASFGPFRHYANIDAR